MPEMPGWILEDRVDWFCPHCWNNCGEDATFCYVDPETMSNHRDPADYTPMTPVKVTYRATVDAPV